MFALFNLGVQEMVVLGGCFLVLVVPAIVLAVLLPMMLRKRPIEPDDRAAGLTPLERAKGAAAALTPEERAALRRSLEPRQPPPPAGGEGITS